MVVGHRLENEPIDQAYSKDGLHVSKSRQEGHLSGIKDSASQSRRSQGTAVCEALFTVQHSDDSYPVGLRDRTPERNVLGLRTRAPSTDKIRGHWNDVR